jgi:hypothetical protein
MKTKYQPDFPERAKKMAEEGLLDEQIASQLGIKISTYYLYQKQHIEFLEALKEGKKKPNLEVEASLFKMCTGWTFQERKARPDPMDKTGRRMKVVEVIEKQVLPNVVAQIFWLKNRMPERWRDVRHLDARTNEPVTQLPDNTPDEELEVVLENVKRLMPHVEIGMNNDPRVGTFSDPPSARF